MLILLVAATLGVAYVTAWGTIERYLKKQPADQGIQALEKQIADAQGPEGRGTVPAATWRAYAQALADARQYARAAVAYKEVLAIEPYNRDAKFQCGLSLALAGQADEFYNFQKELVYGEAKLAVELFERPEAQRYLAEDRFSALSKEAKNQAMD